MKVLVFDVDGVLGNFEKLRILRDKAHIRAVAKKHGIITEEAKKLFFETKRKLKKQNKPSTIATMLHLGISKEKFYEIMNSVEVKNRIILIKNARKVLKKLAKKNKVVALTNTPFYATVKTLKYLRLCSYFDKIYTIDKYDYVKPSAKIFRRILKDFNCRSGYSIGDSIEKDIAPAKKAGLKTILFIHKTIKRPKNVDYVITDLTELLSIIRN